jgi:hypothetical protein
MTNRGDAIPIYLFSVIPILCYNVHVHRIRFTELITDKYINIIQTYLSSYVYHNI